MRRLIILGFMILILIIANCCSAEGLGENEEVFKNSAQVISLLDLDVIRKHVKYFSSLDSRFTGYPGFYEAKNYIVDYFKRLGLKVVLQNISVLVPLEKYAYVEVGGEKIDVHAVYPNLVCLPNAKGLEGRLIYAGKCSLEELEGLEVNGSILLVDFDCGWSWLNGFLFGAKAVIFLETRGVNRVEAEKKYLPYPANLPRYYADREAATKLLAAAEKGLKARIYARVEWKKVEASNIIAVLEGEKSDEIVVFMSYYDAFSVVPALAPGAEDSLGISLLLEIARVLSSKGKPYRTVWFVALAGHYQGITGAREFVEEYFFGEMSEKTGGDGRYVRVIVGLDMASDSDYLALVAGRSDGESFYALSRLDFTSVYGIMGDIVFYRGSKLSEYSSSLQEIRDQSFLHYLMLYTGKRYRVADGLRLSEGKYFKEAAASPVGLILDSEAPAIAGAYAFSLSTSLSLRLNKWSPLDKVGSVNFTNVAPQAEFVAAFAYFLVNWKELSKKIPVLSVSKFLGGQNKGFITLRGRVVEYDLNKGIYVAVPNAIVHIAANSYKHEILVQTDEKGLFEVHGLSPSALYLIEAFAVDPNTGNVVYAPDYGEYGGKVFPLRRTSFIDPEVEVTTVVFKAGSIVFIDAIDPRSIMGRVFTITVNDVRSHTPTIKYGSSELLSQIVYEYQSRKAMPAMPIFYIEPPVAVTFVPEDIPEEVMFKLGAVFTGVYNNLGRGIKVDAGEQIVVNTPLVMARDLVKLDEDRLSLLHSYGVYSGGEIAEKYHARAQDCLRKALDYLNRKKYTKTYVYSVRSWAIELKAYSETRKLISDTVNTAIFFSFMLVPFAFFLERLIFSKRGLKQFLGTLAFYIVFTVLFVVTHPGIAVASSGFMIILSTSALILVTPVLGIMLSEVQERFKELRERLLGRHEARISVASAVTLSFSYSTLSMRRRRARTILTLASLITVVFGMIALSSAYAFSVVLPKPQQTEIKPYYGILIRNPERAVLPEVTLKFFKAWFEEEGVVSAKIWWYPRYLFKPEMSTKPGTNASLRALWALGKEDIEIYNFSNVIVPREVLDIVSEGSMVCIVSSDIVERGIEIGDEILLPGGIRLVVVGHTIKGTELPLDLDLDEISPVDPIALVEAGEEIQTYPRLKNYFVIVPLRVLKLLGDYGIYSISIKFTKKVDLKSLAEELVDIMGVDVYVGSEEGTLIYRQAFAFTFHGWQYLMIPLVIAMFTILNTMLGSIYERTGEIKILSALGLSPTQVFFVFLADAIVMGVVGSFIGYLMATVYAKAYAVIAAERLVFNYTSWFVMIIVVLSVAASLFSTLYPAFKASKLVTPSLARKWKVAGPKGDTWEIPLPFVAEEAEVEGVLAFMKEYFLAHKGERVGKFMVTSDIEYREEEIAGQYTKSIVFTMSLAPYEQGISQRVELTAVWNQAMRKYTFTANLKLLTGSRKLWTSLAYGVMDDVRKQLLLWKILKPEERRNYISRAREILGVR